MPHTLLLADDSVTIQRVIELTFADEDVTVVAVSDGDQAIERLEASPPDIVLADIGMPGKTGYEVAQYVRNSPRLAHIPVVLLTGAFEPVDQARADDAGCDGVLAKPFEPQMVIGRVKELLARPHAGHAVADRPAQEAGAAAPVAVAPASEMAQDQLPQGQLNDYFDRLDAAFSKAPAHSDEAPAAVDVPPAQPAASVEKSLDWFSTPAPADAKPQPWDLPAPPADFIPDLPLTYASPQPETPLASTPADASFAAVASVEPAVEAAPPAWNTPSPVPDERLAPIEESTPVTAPPPPAAPALELPLPNALPLPPLADAFAALLAAEQGAPLPTGALWLTGPPPPPAPAVVSDETIEAITRRVLDRLSDTVVRQAVAEVASTIAERVIREEIERIKANLK